MTTSNRFKSTFAGLLTTLSVLGFAAALPNSAHAVILTATDTLPNFQSVALDFYQSGGGTYAANNGDGPEMVTTPASVTEIDLGMFDFGSAAPALVGDSLVGLQISLKINSLDTTFGQQDFNYDYLTINGINTGILLNNFPDGTNHSANVITGISGDAATAIAASFASGNYTYQTLVGDSGLGDPYTSGHIGIFDTATTTAGQLVIGILNTNPSNTASDSVSQFNLVGGSAILQISDAPIPFEPSQAVGFGLIALFVALWYIPQTKEMMQRMLVPAHA
jgi:hypothetical protein